MRQHPGTRSSLQRARLLGILLLGALLAVSGCGANGSSPSTSGGATTAATPPAVNTAGQATVDSIQLRATISCGLWIVFAPHSTTYSASELAAIKSFLAAHVDTTGTQPSGEGTLVKYDPAHLPPTLQYVAGAPQCSGTYEITNVGSQVIQIDKAGFQSARAPKVYSYTYRLIDACPYLAHCTGGSVAQACPYTASLPMTPTAQPLAVAAIGIGGSDQSSGASASGNADCPNVITLRPGATVSVAVDFSSPAGSQDVWFHGVPALTVTSAKGAQTLTYPTLVNDLVLTPAFMSDIPGHADTGAYPGRCYTQSGSSFTLVTSYRNFPVCI